MEGHNGGAQVRGTANPKESRLPRTPPSVNSKVVSEE